MWAKILKNVVVDGRGCWNWQRCRQGNGYGRLRYSGKTCYVHRVVYALQKGPIPDGLDVCHRCDNRRCCNPDHLFLGTRYDNMNDAKLKGRVSSGVAHSRTVAGENAGAAKLTWKEVLEIRRSSKTPLWLATKYRVSVDNIRRILRHDTWKVKLMQKRRT